MCACSYWQSRKVQVWPSKMTLFAIDLPLFHLLSHWDHCTNNRPSIVLFLKTNSYLTVARGQKRWNRCVFFFFGQCRRVRPEFLKLDPQEQKCLCSKLNPEYQPGILRAQTELGPRNYGQTRFLWRNVTLISRHANSSLVIGWAVPSWTSWTLFRILTKCFLRLNLKQTMSMAVSQRETEKYAQRNVSTYLWCAEMYITHIYSELMWH